MSIQVELEILSNGWCNFTLMELERKCCFVRLVGIFLRANLVALAAHTYSFLTEKVILNE